MIFFGVRYIQEDLFIVLAIFIPLLLLKKERFIEAGIMAGILGHLKYISLLVFFITLLVLMISDKREKKTAKSYIICSIVTVIIYLIIFLLTYLAYGTEYIQRVYLYTVTGDNFTAFISLSLFSGIGPIGVIVMMAILCLYPVFFKIKRDHIALSVLAFAGFALVIPFNYEQMVWVITALLIYLMYRYKTSSRNSYKIIFLSPFPAIALSALADASAIAFASEDTHLHLIIKILFTCSLVMVFLHMIKYLKK
jgi:hypothetical protein